MSTQPSILYIASAQHWYTRVECIAELLQKDYCVTTIVSTRKSYVARLLHVGLGFLATIFKPRFDHVVIGFEAQSLLPLIRLWYKPSHITADIFISNYDTICLENKTIAPHSKLGRLLKAYERWALQQANHLLVDTQQSAQFLKQTYDLESTIDAIYTFAPSRLFAPHCTSVIPPSTVFFYGTGLHLHGIETVLGAAKLLTEYTITFTIAGPFAAYQIPTNTTLIPWINYTELPQYIASATICLGGHFGKSPKAQRVIAGKTFQFAAMQKPIILSNYDGNNELFEHKKSAYLLPRTSAEELADAILTVYKDKQLQQTIATGAYRTVIEHKQATHITW